MPAGYDVKQLDAIGEDVFEAGALGGVRIETTKEFGMAADSLTITVFASETAAEAGMAELVAQGERLGLTAMNPVVAVGYPVAQVHGPFSAPFIGTGTLSLAFAQISNVVVRSESYALSDAQIQADVNATELVMAGVAHLEHVVADWLAGEAKPWGEPVELGALGGEWSRAEAINEDGQIVGTAQDRDGLRRAVFWEGGETTELDTLGGDESSANDINESGQIVGSSQAAEDPWEGFWYATLWQEGEVTNLWALPGEMSVATGINESGQIVGYSVTSDGSFRTAVSWENGQISELEFDGTYSVANGINDAGQIVGSAHGRAVVWEDGQATDLEICDCDWSGAFAINEARQIVGWLQETDESPYVAWLWEDGRVTELATATGSEIGIDINDAGQIVFNAANRQGYQRAMLWDGGQLIDLGTLTGGVESKAEAINNAGQIVGSALNSVSEWRAVLWEGKQVEQSSSETVSDAESAEAELDALLEERRRYYENCDGVGVVSQYAFPLTYRERRAGESNYRDAVYEDPESLIQIESCSNDFRKVSIDYDQISTSVSGDRAVISYHYTGRWDHDDGTVACSSGMNVLVLKRQPSGGWLIVENSFDYGDQVCA